MSNAPGNHKDDTDLRIDIGVIKSQMVDMKAANSQQFGDIKKTLGGVVEKIDNIAYVHETKYADDRKTDAANYATKEELKPIWNMFYAIISTVIVGLVTAFMMFVIKGGIK